MIVSALIVGGGFLLLLWLERRRPLRRAVEPKLRRNVRNLAVAAVGFAALQVAGWLILEPVVDQGTAAGWGLLHLVSLPAWAETLLALALLDYTLYLWHILNHRVPWLWRFHEAHHADLDLDASTALRFHFGELLLSVPWRAAQVVLIGVSPAALAIWQTALLVEIMFHHSNVALPVGVERVLNWLVVTPRMHSIHHSTVAEETGSNFSSGFTIWDALHGTLRLNVPQAAITIGVPAYQKPEELTLGSVLTMPFRAKRESWRLPSGETPRRESPLPTRKSRLAF